MFAAGRILRNHRESGANGEVVGGLSLFVKRPKKKRKPFRWYFPFIWQALLACFLGAVVIIGGTTMCAMGYNAGQLPREDQIPNIPIYCQSNITEKELTTELKTASGNSNQEDRKQVDTICIIF